MAATPEVTKKKRLQLKRRSRQEDNELNWEGIQDYMRIKTKKLRTQVGSLSDQKSTIFEGVTIYVNGHTRPSTDELKELIHLHGGLYEYRLSSSVTHVIATNLPTAKLRTLTNIVCKPEWIIDSIKANKQLPNDNYLLYKATNSQRKIPFPTAMEDITRHHTPTNPVTTDTTTNDPVTTDTTTSSTPKDFVNQFYSHSRLHYLSTWSRELKDFTSKILPSAKQTIPRLANDESLRGRGTHVFVHVDVDSFFVSVSLLDKPQLRGKPVAVTHAKKGPSSPSKPPLGHHSESMSDIASCSYEARKLGVKNGMSVSTALSKCPELILIPYDFEKYRTISQILYESLISYSHQIEAVSCDEAYIELTDYVRNTEEVCDIVKQVRTDIFNKTGCTVSAGISHNILLARLATYKAKPNGQFVLSEEDAQTHLIDQPVSSLPGVGWALNRKLEEYEIETCGQLQMISLDTLKQRHGGKTGEMLYYYSRGIDSRELKLSHEKKSLSVDINFGIRFKKLSEAEELLLQLGEEVEKRLIECDMKGGCVCLKLKVRKVTASYKTKKYLGHGPCDNISQSFNLTTPTQNGGEIGHTVCRLLNQIKVPVVDIRGIGIQLTKLVSCTRLVTSKKKDIRSLLSKPSTSTNTSSTNTSYECASTTLVDEGPVTISKQNQPSLNDSVYSLPSLADLDQSVLLLLPPDMQDKILNEYSSRSCQQLTECNNNHSSNLTVTSDKDDVNRLVNFFERRIPAVIQDQYVTELRNNIRQWVTESINGPSQAESESFRSYICWLAEENFEIVYLALKCLKRVIVNRQMVKEWISLFNHSITIVHSKLLTVKYHGVTDITLLCEIF